MTKRGDYLFKRPDSANWSVRFQYLDDRLHVLARLIYNEPDMPATWVRSLKTPVRALADDRAAPYIARHKRVLLADWAFKHKDPVAEFVLSYERQPGTSENLPDGTRILASEKEIVTILPDGTFQTKPNEQIPDLRILADKIPEGIFEEMEQAEQKVLAATHGDVDQEMLDRYTAKLRNDDKNLANYGLKRFKEINGGKTIAASERSDVKKLIEAEFERRGPNGGGRIQKMMRWLAAAVNHELNDADKPIYTRNIFANHEIKGRKLLRPSYTEADLRVIKENRARFTDEQWLMLVWHVSSSVRPGGIYSITADEWIEEDEYDDEGRLVTRHRTRSVSLTDEDDKGDFGRRTLPIPQAVLDLGILPEKIEGPLFQTPLKELLVGINNKLETIGVNTPDTLDADGVKIAKGKTLYSGRHRARDRFRQMKPKPNEEMTRAIMGHKREMNGDAHRTYGHGFNMFELKPVIDRIRF